MKALALFSGGLDSLLSIKLIQEAGVEVEAVHFLPPYLTPEAERKRVARLHELIGQVHAKLHIEHLGDDYLQMLESPKYGYGRAFNPCLDCHIFFLRKAAKMMKKTGSSFLITGEVVGQRPKSQYKGAFPLIDSEVGLEGLIVRPLSARLLPETVPEKLGWISLKHCPSIQGRDRKIQLHLANSYGFAYETPAGGCLFTNELYAQKINDHIKHSGSLSVEILQLLTAGRHFRFSANFKGIIGRNRMENQIILNYFLNHRRETGLLLLKGGKAPGPLALGLGVPSREDLANLASLSARYSDLREGQKTEVRIIEGGSHHEFRRMPLTVHKDNKTAEKFRI